MTYAVAFTKTAEKQLKKLEEHVQERIFSVLERIRVRPYEFVRKLAGYPYYRLRVGEYRLIVDIKNDILLIFVIEIGHRKNIYKF